jgi:hypothetical protein
MYVTERLRYIHKVLNLRNLSLETVQSFKPFFDQLYQIIVEREIDYLNSILEGYRQKNEIINCDTKRIAASILIIADAIKGKYTQCIGYCFVTDVDHTKIEDEVKFTVSLILDGLIK